MKQTSDVPYNWTKPQHYKRTGLGAIKAYDGEEGIVELYASIAGIQDSYEEIIDRGAFKRTLKEHEGRISFCWQHDWKEVIAKILEVKEVPRSKLPKALQEQYPEATGGLFCQSKIVDTRQGEDAMKLLRAGAIKEASIGFDLYEDGHYKDDDGVVHLSHIVLYEISLVTMGANPGAQVVSYKAAVPEIPLPPEVSKLDYRLPTEIRGEKIYVKTGDGRWWASKWHGSKQTEASPDWELVTDLEALQTKPGEMLETDIIEIIPGINIYSRRVVDIPYGKPEETEDFVRIPNPGIGDCEVTATITISEDEGITALYCGKTKKVRTFIFAKAKGWTMAKAQKWVDDHKDEFKTAIFGDLETAHAIIEHLETAQALLLDSQLEKGYNLLTEIVSLLPQPTLGEAEELALRISILEAETSTL